MLTLSKLSSHLRQLRGHTHVNSPSRSSHPCPAGTEQLDKFCLFCTHQYRQCRHFDYNKGYCQAKKFQWPAHFSPLKSEPVNDRPSVCSFSIASAYRSSSTDHRKFVTVSMNDYPVRHQLDTAVISFVISSSTWYDTGQPPIQPIVMKVRSLCTGALELTGQLQCAVN